MKFFYLLCLSERIVFFIFCFEFKKQQLIISVIKEEKNDLLLINFTKTKKIKRKINFNIYCD